MMKLFSSAGYSATTFNLNLSSWNTLSVTSMDYMFKDTGASSQNFSIIIPKTNGNIINNTTDKLYGADTTKYAESPSIKQFTLASL